MGERAFSTMHLDRASRRGLILTGAVAAALGAASRLSATGVSAQTPEAGVAGGAPLLVQSFSRGSLFPTQGDAGVLPYTLILWDAAPQGVVVVDPAAGQFGIAPTDRVLTALGDAAAPPWAMVTAGTGELWLLRLQSGSLGSDPGAVTYQGDVVGTEEAANALGLTAAEPPQGPQDVTGYLLIFGLQAPDLLSGPTSP